MVLLTFHIRSRIISELFNSSTVQVNKFWISQYNKLIVFPPSKSISSILIAELSMAKKIKHKNFKLKVACKYEYYKFNMKDSYFFLYRMRHSNISRNIHRIKKNVSKDLGFWEGHHPMLSNLFYDYLPVGGEDVILKS